MSALHDFLELKKSLSGKRLRNAARVFWSYYASRRTGVPNIKGMPFSISVEPTTSCNLRCPECPSGLRSFTRPTGMLNFDTYQKVMDDLSDYLIYLILYFQGEPYLNRDIFKFLEYASQKKVYSAISTNAHYLTDENCKKTIESGLSRLIISIDGTSQETYEQYRIGGKLEKVIEGTKNIIRWKKAMKSKTPHVIFQFLVVRPNEHQTEDVKKLAKEIGVDQVVFKTAQVYDFENGNDLIPTIDKYARYKQKPDGTFSIKNKLLNQCWKMWHSCVITWDGKVVPCCFDKDAHHVLGNASEVPFREIWYGDDYQNFRKAILKGRSQIDICNNCTEGTKVWA